MCKRKFKNSALYLLFVTTCANAVQTGAGWLFWISAVLVAAVAIIDIADALKAKKWQTPRKTAGERQT